MSKFQLTDKAEVFAAITAALAELGRSDTLYSYGAVEDQNRGAQIIYFDLPRISPLQFKLPTHGMSERRQLIQRLKAAISKRLESD